MSKFLRVLGILFFIFGIADFLLALFGIDITGSKYSPLVAALIGEGFCWLANKLAPAPAQEEVETEVEEAAKE